MPILTWDDSYSIGIAKIDAQHRVLFALINKTYKQANQVGEGSELNDLAAGMLSYALMHFDTEEELMQSFGFPDTLRHTEMHAEYKRRAEELKQSAIAGQADASDIMEFLSDWVTGHVCGSDKKLGRFLNEHGIH